MRRLLLPFGLAAVVISPSFAVNSNAASLVSSGTVPEAPGPLTLECAIGLASAGNFTLFAAQKEVDANEGAVMQARTIPNFEMAATMEDTCSESHTTTGQLNIPVELDGKRSTRVVAAEKGREPAQTRLATTRTELRSNVIRGFFEVLIVQERVELVQASADLAAKGAQAVMRRVAAGKISPVEETKTKVE